jgi:hypothetical protein
MKFVSPNHFIDPDAAARKLVQIANASAALARAVTLGWLLLHESGTYVRFTPAGAELFA